jgi:hypothetical protein
MGVIYMREELKVGDIIIYYGGVILDYGKKQIILNINDGYIHTIFLDNNMENIFGLESNYRRKCKRVDGDKNYVHNNGVPMVWGDEV